MDENITILLAILGVFLTAVKVMTECQKSLNETRNTILTAKLNNEPISKDDRQHFLTNDWLPTQWCVCVAGVTFGSVQLAVPMLLPADSRTVVLWTFSAIFAVMMWFVTGCFIKGGQADLKLMRAKLAED